MWKKIRKRLNSPDAFISMILGLAVVLVLGISIINAIRSYTSSQKKLEEQKTQSEQQNQKAQLPATYTVKEGDTLWGISVEYYESGYNWVDIAEVNSLENPDLIYPDTKLTIPDVKPRIVEEGQISAIATVRPKHSSYTIADGDTLWDISYKEYETNYKWPDIATTNNIPNPDLIYPGTILQLQ